MIGIICGKVDFINETKILVLTNSGIGYEVNYTYPTAINKEIKVYTAFIVRENLNELFGFETIEQKNLFGLLLKVKGVGPRSAYSLVSSLGVKALVESIMFENKKVLKQAPGIGLKAAAQIILDLKDKITPEIALGASAAANNNDINPEMINSNIINDALSALSELGYKEGDVLGPINKILSENSSMAAGDLVKEVLRERM